MIELKLNTGEDIFLTTIPRGDGVYELVDGENAIHMTVRLNGSHLNIVENINIDPDQADINGKLDMLALQVMEAEQSEVENNEVEIKQEITPYDPDDIKVHQKQFSIKFIQEMIENEDIDFTPDFQRHFVWNSFQKSRLIESLLLRIPLPMFYLAEDEEGRLTVVDGLQRLTTVKEFMNNEFSLKNLEYLSDGVEGRYYKTDDSKGQKGIDAKYYRWFNMAQFSVNVIDPSSPYKVKYDIFRRINTGGRPLKNQEIRNCLSSRSLRKLLNEMAGSEYFKLATDRSIKPDRMEDQEVALRFLIFYEAYKKDSSLHTTYSGYMEPFLDFATEQFQKITDNSHNEYISLFDNAMKNASYLFGGRYAFRKIYDQDIIDPNTRKQLFNKALFVAWSVLLAELPFDKVIEKYPSGCMRQLFADKLLEDEKLMYYLSYGTNGKANLEYVFASVTKIIKEHLSL